MSYSAVQYAVTVDPPLKNRRPTLFVWKFLYCLKVGRRRYRNFRIHLPIIDVGGIPGDSAVPFERSLHEQRKGSVLTSVVRTGLPPVRISPENSPIGCNHKLVEPAQI